MDKLKGCDLFIVLQYYFSIKLVFSYPLLKLNVFSLNLHRYYVLEWIRSIFWIKVHNSRVIITQLRLRITCPWWKSMGKWQHFLDFELPEVNMLFFSHCSFSSFLSIFHINNDIKNVDSHGACSGLIVILKQGCLPSVSSPTPSAVVRSESLGNVGRCVWSSKNT